MLTLNGPGSYWSWCSFICELDIVYMILCFVVCNSEDVSFAQTCKTRCSSILQFFTSTSLCFMKCFCSKTCYRRLLYFLAIKVQSWGKLRSKVESITLTPLANYCIPLFACAFCHRHVEIPFYQQQNRLKPRRLMDEDIPLSFLLRMYNNPVQSSSERPRTICMPYQLYRWEVL